MIIHARYKLYLRFAAARGRRNVPLAWKWAEITIYKRSKTTAAQHNRGECALKTKSVGRKAGLVKPGVPF